MLSDLSQMTQDELVKPGFEFRFGKLFNLESEGKQVCSSELKGVQITVILKTATCNICTDAAQISFLRKSIL